MAVSLNVTRTFIVNGNKNNRTISSAKEQKSVKSKSKGLEKKISKPFIQP